MLGVVEGAIQYYSNYCPNDMTYDTEATVSSGGSSSVAVAGISVEKSLVVWQNSSTPRSVRARVVDEQVGLIGSEFTVGLGTVDEMWPSASAKAQQSTNDVAVAWARHNTTTGWDILMRLYTYSGGSSLTSVTSLQVPSSSSGDQIKPAVQLLWDRSAIAVAWEHPSATTANLRYRMCDTGGTCSGSDASVHSSTSSADRGSVRLDSFSGDGDFVAVWQSDQTTGDNNYNIYYRIFADDGTPAGSEVRVNTDNDWDAVTPDVATLSQDRFVVTWREPEDDLGNDVVWYKIYNFDGTVYHDEDVVNFNEVGIPRVASFRSGSLFAVAYPFDYSGSGYLGYGVQSYATVAPGTLQDYTFTSAADDKYMDHDLDAMQCDSFVQGFRTKHTTEQIRAWYPGI